MATVRVQPSSGRRWLVSVLALSLPAVVFVPLHLLIVVHYYGNSPSLVSASALDALLLWPVFLTGISGDFFTLAALIVTLVACFRHGVLPKTKLLMWGSVAISALARVYTLWVQDLGALLK